MMLSSLEKLLVAGGLSSAVLICPLRLDRPPGQELSAAAIAPAADTATVRLHISGMTCGSCPATARLALRKLAGVYAATIILDDSLGVVRYDPARVTSDEIAAHLTKRTGFPATVLKDEKREDE